MKFASNDVALPDRTQVHDANDPEVMWTTQLLSDQRPAARAQLHERLAPPLLALAFALLTLPLSRSCRGSSGMAGSCWPSWLTWWAPI